MSSAASNAVVPWNRFSGEKRTDELEQGQPPQIKSDEKELPRMHSNLVLINRRQPGPKGPDKELIQAVVELKRRNPNWDCPRIAQQIMLAFGVEIDKDVVRRILGVHYSPESDSGGPSWLTFLGHMKDSLWLPFVPT